MQFITRIYGVGEIGDHVAGDFRNYVVGHRGKPVLLPWSRSYEIRGANWQDADWLPEYVQDTVTERLLHELASMNLEIEVEDITTSWRTGRRFRVILKEKEAEVHPKDGTKPSTTSTATIEHPREMVQILMNHVLRVVEETTSKDHPNGVIPNDWSYTFVLDGTYGGKPSRTLEHRVIAAAAHCEIKRNVTLTEIAPSDGHRRFYVRSTKIH